MNEGVVAHVCGCEGLTVQVGYPVMYLIMTRKYDATLIAVKVMGDGNTDTASIAASG